MRLCRSTAARVVVWLAAVLVPVETLPAVACGCDNGTWGQNGRAGCAGRLACNLDPDSPHPNPLPKGEGTLRSPLPIEEGTRDRGTGRKCCCGRGSACTCGLVCRCGQSHRSDPQLPSNPNVLKVKDLSAPARSVLAGAATALPNARASWPVTLLAGAADARSFERALPLFDLVGISPPGHCAAHLS